MPANTGTEQSRKGETARFPGGPDNRDPANKLAWRFAHHPPHPCFRDHVWLVHGFYLCKGCAVGAAGIVAGALLAWATGWIWILSEERVGLILAALVLPTVVSTLLGLPRPVRHVSRFCLGLATASAFILLIATNRWVVRVAIVAVYFAVKIPLQRLRQRRIDAELARSSKKN